MTIFEKMLDMQVREGLINYKENAIGQEPEFSEQLATYLRSDDCTNDILRLMNGEYFFKPSTRILLKKKYSNKKREVFRYELRDRFLQMLVGHVLHDYDHIFSDTLYSFRRNRNARDLIEKIKAMKNVESRWALKTDFKAYGESVNVELLVAQLEKIFAEDPQFFNFAKNLLLDKRYYWRGKLIGNKFCLKTGSPLTNFFENVYAMGIDELMDDISLLYGRYGDDIVAFFSSKDEAEKGKEILGNAIAKLCLSFNQEKTDITGPDEPVEVLGLKVTGKNVDIADSSIDKIRYRYKRKAKKLVIRKRKSNLSTEWAVNRFVNFTNRRFFYLTEDRHELNWCLWAFPIITRPDSLRVIDHIVQDCLRFVGSGKTSDAKFRVRYKQMQQWGYRSLVHHFYHREKLFENPYVPEVLTT